MNMDSGQKKNKNGLLITIIVLLLLVNVVLFFYVFKGNEEIKEKEVVIAEKTETLDSLTTEMDRIKIELQEKYDQIAQLGGDTAALGARMRQLEKDLRIARQSRYKDQAEVKRIKAELQQKINDYTSLISQKEKEVEELRAANEKLYRENTELKTSIERRNDSIAALSQVKQKLDEQVSLASILRAEQITVAYLDKKGKLRTDKKNEFKAKKVEKIQIDFTIGDNRVAKVETKEAFLRIIEPDGATMSDVAMGGGSFVTREGKEQFYSVKQDFLFDNKRPRVSMVYSKGSEYKKGKHTAEIFVEGAKIGEITFTLE